MHLRRFVWPALLSAAVLLPTRIASIVDSHERAVPATVKLLLPASYVATSPISRLLDTLTLFSNPQTAAFFVSIAAIAVAMVLWRKTRSRRSRLVRVGLALASVLVATIILEASVLFAPRAMARVVVSDSNVVRVDFHSHTRASRDANQRISPEDRRSWHRSGGFDVGYITDHVRFGGAMEAAKNNPVRAGDDVSELSGVEGRYHKILSTIMLGLTQADTAILDRKGHLLPGIPASGLPPVTIVALPNGNIDSVTIQSLDSLPHFSGMELIDAAPRGLGQLDREEAKVRRIASTTRLILVAASNNHGYGRTVAAWNLMTIPGWRSLSPDSVGRLIERPFRERQLDAVAIVKRVRPRTHGAGIVLTLPVAVIQILRTLTRTEQLVWILWIWAFALLVSLTAKTKASD
jgi:hypothetical protein